MTILKKLVYIIVAAFVIAATFFLYENIDSSGTKDVAFKGLLPKVIIIDPGHGGSDMGAVFQDICEDEIAYDIAIRLYKKLKEKKYKVFITIKNSIFPFNSKEITCDKNERLSNNKKITLGNRIALIKEFDPSEDALIISIHVNSLPQNFKGFSIFFKKKNNKNNASYNFSLKLSSFLKKKHVVSFSLDTSFLYVHLEPVRKRFYRWNFTPAIFSATGKRSAVLIETGNLRNSSDRINLLKNSYREKIAIAIAASFD